MQVALGEGANKKCWLLYCLGGHCVVTLSPGAKIWLSPSLFPLCPLYLLISYYPLIPIQPPWFKENLSPHVKGNVNIESVLAVVMRGKLLWGLWLVVIQQCISHSLEALLLHHYLFKLTETVDFACFCVSERPYQNKSLVMNTQWE